MVLPITINRRQTFSRNEITLSTSASLGSLSSGSPDFAPAEPCTPATGSPRAKSSFFNVAFSPCRWAISVSSAERSSGTTLQAQPALLRLHFEPWPVRVSRRSTPSTTVEAVAAVLTVGRRRLRRCGREVRKRQREGKDEARSRLVARPERSLAAIRENLTSVWLEFSKARIS